MKRELTILIGCAALWTAGIVLAPLLYGSWLSDLLYRFYYIICHQFASRSFMVDGHPFGVCIRCTAIYTAFLAMLILIRTWPRLQQKEWNTFRLILCTAVPMAWDGILSLFNVTEATTASRTITGSLFGIGLALMLHRLLSESVHAILSRYSKYYELTTR